MELRLTESHDGHDRGAQIQRGGDTWLGAEKHSWIHAFNSCYANMRAIHCICIDIGDCIEISSHPMSDAPFFIHLHQHVSQCHFGESHDYRYSLRKRPCCIPIRNQCFLFSRGEQTFAAEGSQQIASDFLQFPKVEFGNRQLRWNQLLLQGRGGEEGEVYLRPSREAWRLYWCFIRNPVCFFPLSFYICSNGAGNLFPCLLAVVIWFSLYSACSSHLPPARPFHTDRESSWILLRREGSLTSSNPLAFHGWIL